MKVKASGMVNVTRLNLAQVGSSRREVQQTLLRLPAWVEILHTCRNQPNCNSSRRIPEEGKGAAAFPVRGQLVKSTMGPPLRSRSGVVNDSLTPGEAGRAHYTRQAGRIRIWWSREIAAEVLTCIVQPPEIVARDGAPAAGMLGVVVQSTHAGAHDAAALGPSAKAQASAAQRAFVGETTAKDRHTVDVGRGNGLGNGRRPSRQEAGSPVRVRNAEDGRPARAHTRRSAARFGRQKARHKHPRVERQRGRLVLDAPAGGDRTHLTRREQEVRHFGVAALYASEALALQVARPSHVDDVALGEVSLGFLDHNPEAYTKPCTKDMSSGNDEEASPPRLSLLSPPKFSDEVTEESRQRCVVGLRT